MSKHGVFMVHRSTFSPQNASIGMLKELTTVADIEDKRTEAILRDHVTLKDRDWSDLKESSFWFTAQEALEAGIATSIGDFSPPKGAEIWSFTL